MQQDYIMRIVQQFVQAIVAIMQRRKAGDYKEAREHVASTMRYLLKTDLELLLLYDNEYILDHFKDLNGNFETVTCVLGADLFYELVQLEEAENQLAHTLRLKELCLRLYAIGLPKETEFHDPQHLEKVSRLIEELRNQPLSEKSLISLNSCESFIKSLEQSKPIPS